MNNEVMNMFNQQQVANEDFDAIKISIALA